MVHISDPWRFGLGGEGGGREGVGGGEWGGEWGGGGGFSYILVSGQCEGFPASCGYKSYTLTNYLAVAWVTGYMLKFEH